MQRGDHKKQQYRLMPSGFLLLEAAYHVSARLGVPLSLRCLKNKIQFGALPLLYNNAHYLFRDNIALIHLKLS